MKLILIKPNIGRLAHSLYVDEGRMEPLQMGVLAALTPPDVEVVFYDDRMEPIPFDAATPADLVAITVETYTARRAYEISASFRARGVPVILGGMHPTLLPEEAAGQADAIFLGDAESRWGEVIDDARRGRLKKRYQAPPGPPQPGLVTRRDIFKGKGYLPVTLLQYSRGCRFRCEFCAVGAYFEHCQYRRSLDEVVAEIKSQPRRDLFFVDDNIMADQAAAKALCRALMPLKVRWVSQGSIDMTHDEELLDLMVASGCLGNVIGFESIVPASLRAMKKAPNLMRSFDRYQTQIGRLRAVGLQTWAAFVLGYDHDTVESIEQTLAFALENKFAFAAFNVLMPYPATPLYDRLAAEGRLLYDGRWWLHPEYRFNYAAFKPHRMSAEELTEAANHCRAVFNSRRSIIRRAFDFKTNMRSLERLIVYLMYNPLFRRETFKKHGMRFGLDR